MFKEAVRDKPMAMAWRRSAEVAPACIPCDAQVQQQALDPFWLSILPVAQAQHRDGVTKCLNPIMPRSVLQPSPTGAAVEAATY